MTVCDAASRLSPMVRATACVVALTIGGAPSA